MSYMNHSIYTKSSEDVIEMVEYMFKTKPDIWKDNDKLPRDTRESVSKLIKLRDQMMYGGILGWFFKKRNRVIAEAIKGIAIELELASNAHKGIFKRLDGFKDDDVIKNEIDAIFNRVKILNEKIDQINSRLNKEV